MELKCKLVQMEWWCVNFRLQISTSHVSYFICQIQHNSEANFKPLTSLHLLNIILDALQISKKANVSELLCIIIYYI